MIFQKKENQIRIKIIPCFCQFLIFELKGRGREPNLSQAENLLAEAWLEPAWLGLITTHRRFRLDHLSPDPQKNYPRATVDDLG